MAIEFYLLPDRPNFSLEIKGSPTLGSNQKPGFSPTGQGFEALTQVGRLRSERSLNLRFYHFAVNCQLSTVNCLSRGDGYAPAYAYELRYLYILIYIFVNFCVSTKQS